MQPEYVTLHRIQGQQFVWRDEIQENQKITLSSTFIPDQLVSHLQIERIIRVPYSENNETLGIRLFTCTKGVFREFKDASKNAITDFALYKAINILWPLALNNFRQQANLLVQQDFRVNFRFEEELPIDVIKYIVDEGYITVEVATPISG